MDAFLWHPPTAIPVGTWISYGADPQVHATQLLNVMQQ